jgi:hypothetical protein
VSVVGRRERLSKVALRAFFATVALVVVAALLVVRLHPPPWALVPLAIAMIVPMFAPFALLRRKVTITASEDGLAIGKDLVVPRAKLGDAWLAQTVKGPRLHVQPLGKTEVITVRPDTDADAERLLEALTFGLEGRGAITADVMNQSRLAMLTATGALAQFVFRIPQFHAFGTHDPWLLWPIVSAIVGGAYAVLWVLKRKIVTGADGFEIRAPFRAARFVPYREVVEVDQKGVVHLRSGETLKLGKPLSADARHGNAPPYARALAKIQERVAAVPAQVAKEENAILAVTAADATENAAYRVAAPTEDALWTTVASGQARTSVRARAAKALVASRDAESTRVRIAEIANESASSDAREQLLDAVAIRPQRADGSLG